METEDYIVLGILAVAGYLIWKNSSRWTDAEGAQAMTSAGFVQRASALNPGAMTFSGGKDTFLFREGDFMKLGTAQQILIALDKTMPGTWLTRWALT